MLILFSGEAMHHSIDRENEQTPLLTKKPKSIKYIWWFNTYPLEFAEFLLVTALTRGVWLHPLGPSMSFHPNYSILISYIVAFSDLYQFQGRI